MIPMPERIGRQVNAACAFCQGYGRLKMSGAKIEETETVVLPSPFLSPICSDFEPTILAPNGFAVGGINVTCKPKSLSIGSIQFVFMKMIGNRLDPNDVLLSKWLEENLPSIPSSDRSFPMGEWWLAWSGCMTSNSLESHLRNNSSAVRLICNEAQWCQRLGFLFQQNLPIRFASQNRPP